MLSIEDAKLIVKLLSERVSQLAIEKGLDDQEYREAARVLATFEELHIN